MRNVLAGVFAFVLFTGVAFPRTQGVYNPDKLWTASKTNNPSDVSGNLVVNICWNNWTFPSADSQPLAGWVKVCFPELAVLSGIR
jgi:hypothetical protein